MKPVYLLQPGGLPPVKEECYEGRGRFGVVNAYVWLAKANAETLGIELSGCDDDEIAQIGIQMEQAMSTKMLIAVSYGTFFTIREH
jgi:hypothetical protein